MSRFAPGPAAGDALRLLAAATATAVVTSVVLVLIGLVLA